RAAQAAILADRAGLILSVDFSIPALYATRSQQRQRLSELPHDQLIKAAQLLRALDDGAGRGDLVDARRTRLELSEQLLTLFANLLQDIDHYHGPSSLFAPACMSKVAATWLNDKLTCRDTTPGSARRSGLTGPHGQCNCDALRRVAHTGHLHCAHVLCRQEVPADRRGGVRAVRHPDDAAADAHMRRQRSGHPLLTRCERAL